MESVIVFAVVTFLSFCLVGGGIKIARYDKDDWFTVCFGCGLVAMGLVIFLGFISSLL